MKNTQRNHCVGEAAKGQEPSIVRLLRRAFHGEHEEQCVVRTRYHIAVHGMPIRVFCASLEQALEQAELLSKQRQRRVLLQHEDGELLGAVETQRNFSEPK